MATTIHVKLAERSYPIHIGRGLSFASVIGDKSTARALVVSDTNVEAMHGESVRKQLESKGIACVRAVVPAGEETKSLKWVEFLYEQAASAGLDRNSIIIALGGGMVGDLAGFVAATYLRGVRFVQIPTSLLALVDSSVGGKTGVNLTQGKNLVGAFYQPIEVDADLDLLKTLPQREYVSGLAEVVKYGVIWDASFFHLLEKNTNELLRRDPGLLESVIARCCEIKAEVVAMDEREIGPRAILNFGHTLGHALEKVGGYGRWLHGEAVAMGMHYAAHLSSRVEGFPSADAVRVSKLLQALGLPTRLEKDAIMAWPTLRDAMLSDKKTLKNRPRFVLSQKLGAAVVGCEVEDPLLEEVWNVCCK
ncbi:MAG: 3-dehydroquinate synthase [bacterium]|jgi:3-dehydroquinate synthase